MRYSSVGRSILTRRRRSPPYRTVKRLRPALVALGSRVAASVIEWTSGRRPKDGSRSNSATSIPGRSSWRHRAGGLSEQTLYGVARLRVARGRNRQRARVPWNRTQEDLHVVSMNRLTPGHRLSHVHHEPMRIAVRRRHRHAGVGSPPFRAFGCASADSPGCTLNRSTVVVRRQPSAVVCDSAGSAGHLLAQQICPRTRSAGTPRSTWNRLPAQPR